MDETTFKTHFQRVIDRVCDNWVGLQMAVAHNGNKKDYDDMKTYICDMCFNSKVSPENIEDTLCDIIDEDFDTIFEDDSPREVSQIIWKLFALLNANNMAEFNAEMEKLPNRTVTLPLIVDSSDDGSDDDDDDSDGNVQNVANNPQQMDVDAVDDGWTTVTARKKR